MTDDSTDAQLTDYDGPQDSPAGDVPKRRIAWTALEIAEQVSIVQNWLAEGARPNVIRARCADRWGLATRSRQIAAALRAAGDPCGQLISRPYKFQPSGKTR